MAVEKYNILYLFSDQHRFDASGCYGNKVCKTPNLDQLAAEGVRFDSAYTVNALCTPARASVMTGLYPHNHGQLANMGNFNGVFDNQITDKSVYPRLLKESDYQVGYCGKWHLPKSDDKSFWGFDDFYPDAAYHANLKEKGIDYDMGRDEVQPLEWGEDAVFHGKAALPAEEHHDAWVADRTIDLIKQYSSKEEPFMICSAFFGPHFPVAVPEPYNTMYNPADVPRWGNFDEQFMDKPTIQQKELMRWNAAHLTWPDWQKVIAAYWGYCTFIDDQIGRILNQLKESGAYENTLIIYSSDHGDMLGSHRLFNKGFNMYEECNRIPLVISGPLVHTPNTVSDDFVNLTDMTATILDASGSSFPEQFDGRSLIPLLQESPVEWNDDILVEFHGYESTLASIRMVRTKRWKYVYNPFAEDELYDMESDPHELTNLANKLAFKHVLRRMKNRLVEWLRETNDGIVDATSWQSNSYDLFISDREL